MEITNKKLLNLFNKAPLLEGWESNKMAFYSANCCWWTSNPKDLGHKSPFPHLPTCPHCGSVLFQAPLKEFLLSAQSNPNHYGKNGLDTFLATHHGNHVRCYNKFAFYEGVN